MALPVTLPAPCLFLLAIRVLMALLRTHEATLEDTIPALMIKFATRPATTDNLVSHDILRSRFRKEPLACPTFPTFFVVHLCLETSRMPN